MIPRVTEPIGDDWLVRVKCRRRGVTETRWVGVSAGASEEGALWQARKHINPPRASRGVLRWEILDMEVARMWEWRARKLLPGAPANFQDEVARWQRASA